MTTVKLLQTLWFLRKKKVFKQNTKCYKINLYGTLEQVVQFDFIFYEVVHMFTIYNDQKIQSSNAAREDLFLEQSLTIRANISK